MLPPPPARSEQCALVDDLETPEEGQEEWPQLSPSRSDEPQREQPVLDAHDDDSADSGLLNAREPQAAQESESESDDGLLEDCLPRHTVGR